MLAGSFSTGGLAIAATATTAHAATTQCCRGGWDHRGHDRFNRDHHGWYGHGWDHRGGGGYGGWSWQQQCDWAYYNDRGWWYANCS